MLVSTVSAAFPLFAAVVPRDRPALRSAAVPATNTSARGNSERTRGDARASVPSGRMARFLKGTSGGAGPTVDGAAASFTPPGRAHRGASIYRTDDGAIHDVKYEVSAVVRPCAVVLAVFVLAPRH